MVVYYKWLSLKTYTVNIIDTKNCVFIYLGIYNYIYIYMPIYIYASLYVKTISENKAINFKNSRSDGMWNNLDKGNAKWYNYIITSKSKRYN